MHDTGETGKGFERLLLALLFGLALFLRTAGLSHDLDRGNVYHPDTPKQVWAVQRFLQGTFYYEVGSRDYDGYPYFNSLLVAGVTYPVWKVSAAVRNHLGIGSPAALPDTLTLFWVTRLFNALLSSLAILVLYRVGRRLASRRTAFLACLLLALSPADVTAAHYAAGDTTAAFFALLAVLFSLRVLEEGRLRDYLGAALFVVCSFSAKYSGALSVAALVAAHVFRHRTLRDLLSRRSLLLTVAAAVAGLAAFVLTNPAVLVHPAKALSQIAAFLRYTSDFHLPAEIQSRGLAVRLLFGLQQNLPALVDILGPVVFACAAGGLLAAALTRNRPACVVASLPLAYIFVGLTTKPVAQPVYHTLVTAPLVLLAAVALARVARFPRWRPALALVTACAAIFSAGYLANYAWREVFFFSMPDTRVLAAEWVLENVPDSYRVAGSRYSLVQDSAVTKRGPFDGIAWVRSDMREKVEPGDPLVAAFDVESAPLSFRNFRTEIYLGSNAWIRQGFTMPVFQSLPSQFDSPLILADASAFYRSSHVLLCDKTARKVVFSSRRLRNVVVSAQGLAPSSRVEIKFGGRKIRHRLQENTPSCDVIADLRPRWPVLRNGYLYDLTVRPRGGRVLVRLGFTPEEKGVLLYQGGAYDKARPWLARAATHERNPTLAAMAQVAHAVETDGTNALPALPALPDRPITSADLTDFYGVSARYLDALPYVRCRAARLAPNAIGFQLVEDPETSGKQRLDPATSDARPRVLRTDRLLLPAGCYRAVLATHPQPEATVSVPSLALETARGRFACASTRWPYPPSSTVFFVFPFEVPDRASEVSLCFEFPTDCLVSVAGLEIRPDVLASVNRVRSLAGCVAGSTPVSLAASAANAQPLLAFARSLEKRGETARAAEIRAAVDAVRSGPLPDARKTGTVSP